MPDRPLTTQSNWVDPHCGYRPATCPYGDACADCRPAPAPTWKCEYCGKFYSERTAAKHGWCQQEQDRKDAESMWPA